MQVDSFLYSATTYKPSSIARLTFSSQPFVVKGKKIWTMVWDRISNNPYCLAGMNLFFLGNSFHSLLILEFLFIPSILLSMNSFICKENILQNIILLTRKCLFFSQYSFWYGNFGKSLKLLMIHLHRKKGFNVMCSALRSFLGNKKEENTIRSVVLKFLDFASPLTFIHMAS